MSKFTGIDISKETFDAAFLTTEGASKSAKYTNDTKGFEELLKELHQQSHVVMEASGPYYSRLAYFLHEQGIRVSVVNPLIIRRFCQMRMVRAKTDRKDAVMIAEYARTEQPDAWQPDAQACIELRQINTVLDELEKQGTALSNQREALLQMPIRSQAALDAMASMQKALQLQINTLETRQLDLVKVHYREGFRALQSIPGIGPKTAILLIAVTDNFQKFEHYKQLISYVGLSPRIFESGTSVKGKGRICKMGMGRIRKTLYMCSWSAKRYNSFCKEMYERLKSKGKPERVIKIALANKLLRQAFAIGKKLTMFDNNHQNKLAF